MSSSRLAKRHKNIIRLQQRAKQQAKRKAFLAHIKKTAEIVESWPEWKKKL